MNLDRLRVLLEDVKRGEVDVDEAIQSLRHLPFEDLGFSKVDHHRQLRKGFPGSYLLPRKNSRSGQGN